MFYIATNQICTTTGIQDDSIKEHGHICDLTHKHTLTGSLGDGQGTITYDGLINRPYTALTFNIITGKDGSDHSHTGKTISNDNYQEGIHTHTLYNNGKNAVTDAGKTWIAMTDYSGRETVTLKTNRDGVHTHKLSIDEGGEHTHNITQTIRVNESAISRYTNSFGGTETRPKNRLFRIWRRTL